MATVASFLSKQDMVRKLEEERLLVRTNKPEPTEGAGESGGDKSARCSSEWPSTEDDDEDKYEGLEGGNSAGCGSSGWSRANVGNVSGNDPRKSCGGRGEGKGNLDGRIAARSLEPINAASSVCHETRLAVH